MVASDYAAELAPELEKLREGAAVASLVVVTEAGAILLYLARKGGKRMPRDLAVKRRCSAGAPPR